MNQSWMACLWVAVLGGCLGVIGWVATQSESAAEIPALAPPPAPAPMAPSVEVQRSQFYDLSVQPAVMAVDRSNRQAAMRCVSRIEDSFAGYREGIQPFCDEVNSWGTRFGVLKRMPGDWWSETDDVSRYVEAKFGKHLFTDARLTRDVEKALAEFRGELTANRNQMLVSIQAAVESQNLPDLPAVEPGPFSQSVDTALLQFASGSARDSVVAGLLTEIASGVGGLAVEQLLAQLVVRLGAMAGSAAAGAGGATAGGAAVGGGAGALGGPIGAAAGIAAGLVAGIVIDWWMSGRFEAKMSAELNEIIDELANGVIHGNGEHHGIAIALEKSCDQMRDAYRGSLYERIVLGAN